MKPEPYDIRITRSEDGRWWYWHVDCDDPARSRSGDAHTFEAVVAAAVGAVIGGG